MSKPSDMEPTKEQVIQRIMMASSRRGRLSLRLYTAWKVGAWKITTGSLSFIKRLIDILGSLAVILMISPIMIGVALLIRRDGGPAIFRQPRVGVRGELFTIYKFRSMCMDAEKQLDQLQHLNEKEGVTFKMKDDPRITPIGRIIRKTSIDELPQFFNVLFGDMSLVGPRPQLPKEVAQYEASQHQRLLAKPGITCLWQIGEREGNAMEIGDRNEIDFPEQVSLDLRYIESQSILKDILILLKTVPVILLGKGSV